jgi:arylsulfatase A-like enzyme
MKRSVLKQTIQIIIILSPFLILNGCMPGETSRYPGKPNIIVFYADDLGYGDLSCYGATEVETPNVDSLAASGVRFTDAHSTAATCTPSRYSLLTGNYPFRMNAGILPGDAPLLISPGTPTLPSMLQQSGYRTAVVGKWHLGLGEGDLEWNSKIQPGPLEIGFDYSFIIPATNDRVPCVYLENHNVVGLDGPDSLKVIFTDDATEPNPFGNPTGISDPEQLKQAADIQHSGVIVNGVSRVGFMAGAEGAWWRDEDFPEVLTEKAISFIKESESKPFFLFFPFNEIHVPRLPHERFQGATDMGPRGDAIVQMDWMVGHIMEAIEKMGLKENTLVLFSSDNGPVLNDGYEDGAVELLGDHKPSGPFRGGKYSVYEGGNRVPTIVNWPGVVEPGQVSDALWSQVDLIASIGHLVNYEISPDDAKDSQEMLNVLLGESKRGREVMLEEAFTFGIRKNNWKYIAPTMEEHAWISETKNIEGGISTNPQLYNLENDPGEKNNLAEEYPEKVKEMESLLQAIKDR